MYLSKTTINASCKNLGYNYAKNRFFLVSVYQEQHTNCRSSEHKHPERYENESIHWSIHRNAR